MQTSPTYITHWKTLKMGLPLPFLLMGVNIPTDSLDYMDTQKVMAMSLNYDTNHDTTIVSF